MSKYLANRGHEVTVFSFTGSHYLLLKKSDYIAIEECHEGVKFRWFRSIQFRSQSLPVRMLNWQLYNWKLKMFLKNFEGIHPDSIIYSIPALHQVRLMPLAKQIFPKSRHILEIRDIWPLSIQELGGVSKNNPIIKRLKQSEKLAFDSADDVVAVQPGISEYVKHEFPKYPKDQVHFLPHAYIPETVEQNEVEFDIGYAGTIGRANDLKTLLKSLWLLKKEKQYEPKVLIVGSGVNRKKLMRMASGLNHVTFKDWMPRAKTLKELAKCKLCFDGLLDLPMYKYGFSRLKWVDFMMLKKAIIASYSGDPIDVDIEQIGWQVEAENPVKLADIIIEALDGSNYDQLKSKGEKGYEFIMRSRHIDILGAKFEEIITGSK